MLSKLVSERKDLLRRNGVYKDSLNVLLVCTVKSTSGVLGMHTVVQTKALFLSLAAS